MAFRELSKLNREMYLRAQIDELRKLYSSAQKKLTEQLAKSNITDFQKFRAKQLLAQVDVVTAQLNNGVYKWAKSSLPYAYDEGIDLAGERLKALKVTRFVSYDAKIHTSAVDALISDVSTELIMANSSIDKLFSRVALQTQQTALQDAEISRMISEGLIEGETRRGISNKILDELKTQLGEEKYLVINGKNYRPDKYAELVARTRTREATTQGTINTALRYGVDTVQWDAHAEVCEYCQQFSGRVYSISGTDKDFPALTEKPPLHPNCVIGSTEIVSPDIEKVMRFLYKGDLFKISFSNGRNISITPNHMFLTDKGFVTADRLRKGNNIIDASGLERVIFSNPDTDKTPSTIEDIFYSLFESGGVSSACVPLSSKDFHGDGGLGDGNIDIISSDSFLSNTIKSLRSKNFEKFIFDRTHFASEFDSFRDFFSMLLALALSSDGSMSSSGIASILGRRSFPHHQSISQELISGYNSRFDKATSNGSSINIKNLSQTIFRLSGKISLTNVIDIKREFFHGFVYDLSSLSTLYISNGVLSSNCRCVLSPITRENLESRGYLDEEIKLSNSPTIKVDSFSRFEEVLATI